MTSVTCRIEQRPKSVTCRIEQRPTSVTCRIEQSVTSFICQIEQRPTSFICWIEQRPTSVTCRIEKRATSVDVGQPLMRHRRLTPSHQWITLADIAGTLEMETMNTPILTATTFSSERATK